MYQLIIHFGPLFFDSFYKREIRLTVTSNTGTEVDAGRSSCLHLTFYQEGPKEFTEN